MGCRCQGKKRFMFPFPREYDRCLSIKNNHFTNVRQISYPMQLIARGDAAEPRMQFGRVPDSDDDLLLLS